VFSHVNLRKREGYNMIEENFNGLVYRLVKQETGEPVSIGDPIENHRGEPTTIRNAACPRHEASSGRVNNYFPHVYDLEWIKVVY